MNILLLRDLTVLDAVALHGVLVKRQHAVQEAYDGRDGKVKMQF